MPGNQAMGAGSTQSRVRWNPDVQLPVLAEVGPTGQSPALGLLQLGIGVEPGTRARLHGFEVSYCQQAAGWRDGVQLPPGTLWDWVRDSWVMTPIVIMR